LSIPLTSDADRDVVGFRYVSPGRTIGAAETALLCSLSWTRGPMHTNLEAARQSILGGLSLPGPVVTAVVSGLWSSGSFGSLLEEEHGLQLLAILETRSRFLLPLFVNDTVHAEVTVDEIRWSKRRAGRATLVARVVASVEGHGEPREVVEITEYLLAQRVPS
jgi:acyl dehydratase